VIDMRAARHRYVGKCISAKGLSAGLQHIGLTGILGSPTLLVYRIPARLRDRHRSSAALSDPREIVWIQPRMTLSPDCRRTCKS
jgi:hypothetical protein